MDLSVGCTTYKAGSRKRALLVQSTNDKASQDRSWVSMQLCLAQRCRGPFKRILDVEAWKLRKPTMTSLRLLQEDVEELRVSAEQ